MQAIFFFWIFAPNVKKRIYVVIYIFYCTQYAICGANEEGSTGIDKTVRKIYDVAYSVNNTYDVLRPHKSNTLQPRYGSWQFHSNSPLQKKKRHTTRLISFSPNLAFDVLTRLPMKEYNISIRFSSHYCNIVLHVRR